jgi:predicted CXXCH cytochrome family protein
MLVFASGLACAAGEGVKSGLDNEGCLACHDGKTHKLEVSGPEGKARPLLAITAYRYGQGVHAKMQCVACHTGITDNPVVGAGHTKDAALPAKSIGCVECHEKLWDAARQDNTAAAKPRLGVVVQNIEAYRKSYHARPSKEDRTKANATCDGCHDTHTFNNPPASSPEHAASRLADPGMCGEKCHTEQLEAYTDSVHGKQVLGKGNPKAAVCADCHSAHSVGSTSAAPIKVAITATCGGCHSDSYKTYKATYHGQIHTLGYANTAKCFDCHGSHAIVATKSSDSKVHPSNRLETCGSCHNGKKAMLASAGFATFQPHASTDDFARYPQVWIGFRMMAGLLVGTFAFFWLHTALWFYREIKDRRQPKLVQRIKTAALPLEHQGKHVRRFSAVWRVAHLTFAVSLMLLTLTGMPLLYADAAWAPALMQAMGGPAVAGAIHRACAVIFAGVFFWHLLYIGVRLFRSRKTFRWFGPDSLVPTWQDIKDIVAMFKWFVGAGPRPAFDRWTYWEKFDYWAPFWGVTIIGVSGLMMWLPNLTGTYLPGWVFNVAAIFHGEEAFLAVVFLFTVHFFNNHFRPEKFPLEIVMFTGTVSLEEFRHDHSLEYDRLVKSGEIGKFLVEAPSAPMTLASKVLGFTLIAVGLMLLAGVAVGFFGGG